MEGRSVRRSESYGKERERKGGGRGEEVEGRSVRRSGVEWFLDGVEREYRKERREGMEKKVEGWSKGKEWNGS